MPLFLSQRNSTSAEIAADVRLLGRTFKACEAAKSSSLLVKTSYPSAVLHAASNCRTPLADFTCKC